MQLTNQLKTFANSKQKQHRQHQFVDRETGEVRNETLLYDRHIRWMYSSLRESAPWVFKWISSSPAINDWLATINFDKPIRDSQGVINSLVERTGVRMDELLEPMPVSPTWRDFFGRKIRFWDYRPMSPDPRRIVAPCDSRLLLGNLTQQYMLQIKEKFFSLAELLDKKETWVQKFKNADWAIFRLTPEMYHYNHCPVAGAVVDFYEIGGAYHSCNPTACVETVTPYSKNRRFVTIFDTDVPGGTGIGKVAMIEVVALLIGRVRQCYSHSQYKLPTTMYEGLMCKRGAVKSVFEPGSSTVVLLFEKNRVKFDSDLLSNQARNDAFSRFGQGFDAPMVETELQVRSGIGTALDASGNKRLPRLVTDWNIHELST
jgi:phosphatidylserine decarboxylase